MSCKVFVKENRKNFEKTSSKNNFLKKRSSVAK